jgi:hypothetical protein
MANRERVKGEIHTPLEPDGSRVLPHAFILLLVRSGTWMPNREKTSRRDGVMMLHSTPCPQEKERFICSHKGVVHRDYKDLASVFELRRVDIARDVVLRT